MTEFTTTCPSGLTITVRGLKASEMDLFANKQEIASKMISNKILRACTVGSEDPGVIYKGQDILDDNFWDTALVCDRFSALLAIRVATHGSDYAFTLKCSEESCGKPFEWGLDLNKLQRYPLPKTSIPYAVEDAPIRDVMESGTVIFFRLLRGADERAIHQQIEKNYRARVTTGIARRLSKIVIDGKELVDFYLIKDWVMNLSATEALDLVSLMDSHDGGYETEEDVYCPHCSKEMLVNLPFDEEFWIKKPPSTSSRRKERLRNQGL